MNNSLYALLFLLSGITARCDGACSSPTATDPVFNTIGGAIDYYNTCSFSASKFNSSCVLSDCTKLSGLCPYDATGCVNATAFDAITSVLSTCLQTQEVICGVTVGRTPLCPFEVFLGDLAPSLFNASCVVSDGQVFINNLNQCSLRVTGSDGPFSLFISAPNIASTGTYTCTYSSPLLGPTAIHTAPDQNVLITLNVEAQATIDPTTQLPTVKVKVQSSQVSYSACDFNGLPQVLIDAYNFGINSVFQKSGTDVAGASFVATYVASGLQAAMQNCPKNN